MVRLVGLSDLVDLAERQVVRIGGRLIILERNVVLDIVRHRGVDIARRRSAEFRSRLGDAGVAGMRRAANRDPVVFGGRHGRGETARKPAPGHALVIQQVADVLAEELPRAARRAVVEVRVDVAEQCALTGRRIIDKERSRRGGQDRRGRARTRRGLHNGPMSLAGDQVDRAVGRRPIAGVERIVAHGKVLGVVPQRGDGVAVEIGHDGRRLLAGPAAAWQPRPVWLVSANMSIAPPSAALCSSL